jgi:hypothetical protein
MKKKQQITTVSFNEGKERVRAMVNETFSHMIGDIILDLQQVKTNSDYENSEALQSLANMLQTFIHMQKSLLADLDKCYCLAEIVNLSGEYDMFEECEEQLVGAFLGQNIIITQ